MFGLPKRIVIFDTEFTSWEGCNKNGWDSAKNQFREIIQLGAVKVDTEELKEIDSFDCFVQPVKNPLLSDYIKNLTGISQEQVDAGVSLQELFASFNDWRGDCALYSSGDHEVMQSNAKLIDLDFWPFKENDFSNIRDVFRAQGLETADIASCDIITLLGKKQRLRPHNALNDARLLLAALQALAEQHHALN